MNTVLEPYTTLNTCLLSLVHSSSNDEAIRHLEFLVQVFDRNTNPRITVLHKSSVLYNTAASAVKVLKSSKILHLSTPACVSCVDRVIHELFVLIDSTGIREDLLTVGSCSRLVSDICDSAGVLHARKIIVENLDPNVGELRIGCSDITEDVAFIIESVLKTLEESSNEYNPMTIKYVSSQLDGLYHLLSLASRIEG